jgi:ComF family protein
LSSALAAAGSRLLLDPLLAVVFPCRCPACQRPLARPTRGPLCEACWAALPRHRAALCRCGVPLAGGERCGRCRRGLTAVAAGASLGPLEGTLRVAIHELKYHGRRRAAARLAEALLAAPEARALLAPGAVLIPVPLHPRRRRARGYNQAEWLAAELARRTGLELAPAALVRRTDTPPQTGLSAAARRANVRGAFAVRQRARVCGRVVVVVDDVLTTGATALACALALSAAGAREVRLLTLARAA